MGVIARDFSKTEGVLVSWCEYEFMDRSDLGMVNSYQPSLVWWC